MGSAALGAHGGVWHMTHALKGVVPHTSIDTEAHWSKSGWQAGPWPEVAPSSQRCRSVESLEAGNEVAPGALP